MYVCIFHCHLIDIIIMYIHIYIYHCKLRRKWNWKRTDVELKISVAKNKKNLFEHKRKINFLFLYQNNESILFCSVTVPSVYALVSHVAISRNYR